MFDERRIIETEAEPCVAQIRRCSKAPRLQQRHGGEAEEMRRRAGIGGVLQGARAISLATGLSDK